MLSRNLYRVYVYTRWVRVCLRARRAARASVLLAVRALPARDFNSRLESARMRIPRKTNHEISFFLVRGFKVLY